MTHTFGNRSFTRREMLTGMSATAIAPHVAVSQPETVGSAGSTRHRDCGTARSTKFDVERFVEDCRRARERADAHEAIHEILARAISNPEAVLLGVGEPRTGGISTLYRSADLTVLNIVWSPLMQLMPHDHRMWSVIGIYTGREDNIFWRRHENSVLATQAEAISAGRAVSLAKDVIHSVANPIGSYRIRSCGRSDGLLPRSAEKRSRLREHEGGRGRRGSVCVGCVP
jgi:predicted metal-dependent enzyme (double-stranded beta helix superfamily)